MTSQQPLGSSAPGATLGDIVSALGGELVGAPEQVVNAIAPLESAGAQNIAFLAHPKYRSQLQTTQAGCVIVSPVLQDEACARGAVIVTPDPYLYFAQLTQWWASRTRPVPSGQIHPSAVIDASAAIGNGATIGPLAVVEAGAVIGDGALTGGVAYEALHLAGGLQTPMVIVLEDGEVIRGVIEWYDKGCLKVNREGDPNILLYKSCIKYMYKNEEIR